MSPVTPSIKNGIARRFISSPAAGLPEHAAKGEIREWKGRLYKYNGYGWGPLRNPPIADSGGRALFTNEFPDPRATALTHWTGVGTLSIQADAPATSDEVPAATSPTSVQSTFTSGGASSTVVSGAVSTLQTPNGTPVVPGDVLAVRASLKPVAGTFTLLSISNYYYNAAGAALTGNHAYHQIDAKTADIVNGTWYHFDGFDQVPVGAAFVRVWSGVSYTNATGSVTLRMTNVHVVRNPGFDVPELVAGDIAMVGTRGTAAWVGTANNSKSTRYVNLGKRDPTINYGFNDFALANEQVDAAVGAGILAQIGADASRLGFLPGKVTGSQEEYDLWVNDKQNPTYWEYYDRLFGELDKRDVKIYMNCGWSSEAAWMNPSATNPTANAYGPEAAFHGMYANVVAEAIRRYGDMVVGLEIWNEPNLSFFWWPRADPVEYTALMNTVTDAVRAVRTDIPIAGGSLSHRMTNNNVGGNGTVTITPTVQSGGSLTASTTFYYKVTAINSRGESTPIAAEVSAATTATNRQIQLSMPSPNTSATAGNASVTKVRLWRGTATNGQTGYREYVISNATLLATWAASPTQPLLLVDDGTVALTTATVPATNTAVVDESYENFLTTMYAQGAGPKMDAVAYHPYTSGHGVSSASINTPTGNDVGWSYGIEENTRRVRAIMTTNGDSTKPMHMTELGWTTLSGVTEKQQAQGLSMARGWLARRGIKFMFFHTLFNTSTDPAGYEVMDKNSFRERAAFRILGHDWVADPFTRHVYFMHPEAPSNPEEAVSAVYEASKLVRVASPYSNISTTSPGATIDGITMVAGDRVLLKNQTDGLQNGIWIWNGASTAMTRSFDAGSGNNQALRAGVDVRVQEGTRNGGSIWRQETLGERLIGNQTLSFTRVGQITRTGLQEMVTNSQRFVNTAAVAVNDVVVIDTATDGRVTTTTTANSNLVMGVALHASSAAGTVEVALQGSIVQVNATTTAISRGALLATTTTAGQVAAATAAHAAVLGKAIAAKGAGVGPVWIVVTIS